MYGDDFQFNRTRSLAILVAGIVFLACGLATVAWVAHTYIRPREGAAVEIPVAGGVQAKMPAIGGMVRNQQGNGIPGVRVRLNWNDATKPQGQNNQQMILSTDAVGRWSYDGVPQAALAGIGIWFTRGDYVALNQHPAPQSLLDKSAMSVMTRGLEISGTVVDALGFPVSGAQVFLPPYGPRSAQPRGQTNDRGQFVLRQVPPNTHAIITATHQGFAAAAKSVDITDRPLSTQLHMPPARMFAGHVFDTAGHPVQDAIIQIQAWNGVILPGGVHVNTDPMGRFEIRDAPADAIDVQFNKQNFYTQTHSLPADADHLDFYVSPIVTARGRITDAKTHQPINNFTLTVGIRDRADHAASFSDKPRPFNNGRFQIQFDDPNQPVEAWFVRIEARGYDAATSDAIRQTGRADIALQPAPPAQTQP